MASTTGNSQPQFQCPKCGKQFCRKTNVTKHLEKVHVNPKIHKCKICKKTFQNSTHLKRHVLQHDKVKRYKCPECPLEFNIEGYVKTHMKRVHGNKEGKIYPKCELCGKKFTSRSTLNKHIRVHLGEEPKRRFQCTQCDKNYSQKHNLVEHVNKVHENRRNFQCKVCLKSFPSNRLLTQHKLIHDTVKKYKCQQCSNEFSSSSSLFSHQKRIHEDKEKLTYHPCELCGKKFLCVKDLYNHIRGHLGEKPYKCEICSVAFTQQTSLNYHVRSSHQKIKRYECEKCQVKYTTKQNLNKHIESVHEGVRHMCKSCQQTFASRNALKYHERMHRDGKRYLQCPECLKLFDKEERLEKHRKLSHGPEDLRKHKCDTCGKGFHSRNALQYHAVCHTREKAFKCNICSKRFGLKAHLTRHLRTVHGAQVGTSRKCSCVFCHKQCDTEKKLWDHYLRHTKETPFPCRVCHKSFVTKSERKKHSYQVHGMRKLM